MNTTFFENFDTRPDTTLTLETINEETTLETSPKTDFFFSSTLETLIDALLPNSTITKTSKLTTGISMLNPETTENLTEQRITVQTDKINEPKSATTIVSVTNDRFFGDTTTFVALTGPTLLVSTSSGIISPRPSISDPQAIIITGNIKFNNNNNNWYFNQKIFF